MKYENLSPLARGVLKFLIPASNRCTRQYDCCNLVLGAMIVWNVLYFSTFLNGIDRAILRIGPISIDTIWTVTIVAYACFVLYMDFKYGWAKYPPKDAR
jgi:hypothetical protein